MPYEHNIQRYLELQEPLDEYIQHRDAANRRGGDPKQRGKQMQRLAEQLVDGLKPDDAALAYNYLEATAPPGAPTDWKSMSEHVRTAWVNSPLDPNAALPAAFEGLPDESPAALATLPPGACLLRLSFPLDKPYISKDNALFHVLDNPLRKEWVFRVPEIAAASWKGGLRAAFWQRGLDEKDPTTRRLFGPEPEQEAGWRGRLHFFPTFFPADKISIEVINPHKRDSGVGDKIIHFEAVGTDGVRGTFWLLYVPFGPGPRALLPADLRDIAPALQELLLLHGIGAKTSAGYGTAWDNIAGALHVREPIPPFDPVIAAAPPPAPPPALNERDQWLLAQLDDGTGRPVSPDEFARLVEETWPEAEQRPNNYNAYRRKHYKRLVPYLAPPAPAAQDATEEKPALFSAEFSGFAGLNQLIDHIAAALPQEAGDDAHNS